MKYLFLAFITLNVMASNWMPLSKIESLSSQAHQLEADCKKSGEQCLDVGDEPEIVKLGFTSLAPAMGDDTSKPIYEAESQVEVCSGIEECQTQLNLKTCGDGYLKFIDAEYTKTYCTTVTGFEQKEVGKALVKDLTAFNAYKAAQAQVQALNNGIAQATSAMDCGRKVQAHLLVRNAPKGLTKPQVKQLVSAYKDIKNLLDTGSLASAKEEIEAATADGVIITTGDKAALVAQINTCLGL